MRSKFFAGVLLAAAVVTSSCDNSPADPNDDRPHVVIIAVGNAPAPPAGTFAVCYTGPDGGTESNTCPVIKWNDVTYWIFAYEDARNSVDIVAYDKHERILQQSEREGTRQIYLITVNDNAQQVVLYGFGAATATVPWSDLVID
jgi:hypothetical protein